MWPGATHRLVSCTLDRAQWTPGVECVATFRFELSGDSGRHLHAVGAVAATRAGVRHWLCTDDAALPGLAEAADAGVMSTWLADHTGNHGHTFDVTTLRYRPGRRCVLRYTPSRGGPVFFGKVLDGERCLGVAAALDAVGPELAPPKLGCVPAWQLVVQGDAGSSLGALDVDRPNTARAVHEAGRLVAQLHRGAPGAGAVRTLADDVAEVGEAAPIVGRVDPAAAQALHDSLDVLSLADGGGTAGAPAHGALRLNQIHAANGRLRMIDLDTYCQAPPERDVANLVAYLRWRAIRRAASPDAVERNRAAFLAGYARDAQRPLDMALLGCFEAASLLKIAVRRCRGLDVERWQYLPGLVAAARASARAA